MSRGLYTEAEIARYFGKRPQEVAKMIERDGLPAVSLPGPKKMGRKFTLHGIHTWMKARHSGTEFMTVDELAAEIEAAQAEDAPQDLGLLQLRAAVEIVFESIKEAMGHAPKRAKAQTANMERRAA